jgi:hypothetical protein
LEETNEKLSEVGATSDRFGGKTGKAVRSRGNFRQVWWKKRKSCPNQRQLRTGLEEKQENLSEPKATSDRFGGKTGKAVRTKCHFGQV